MTPINMNITAAFLRSILFAFVALCVVVGETDAQSKKPTKKTTKKSSKQASTKDAPTTAPQAQDEVQSIDKPDLNNRPKALPGTPFAFPDYERFDMPNGMTVFVVENHEQPTITISLVIRGGEAVDPPGKEGVASLAADMLAKGTKKRAAREIALALDGVGASISANVVGESITITGSSLKKHVDLLLDIMFDQLCAPTFPEEELVKLKQQYVAAATNEKSRPAEIAQALSRKVIYGFENPLGRRRSEKSINAVTREDVVKFYEEYVRPNVSAMAVVGDVNPKEARTWLTKYATPWQKKSTPTVSIPDATPAPQGVYFVPRKGSVQSSIVVCATAPAVKDPMWLPLDVGVSYFGSGFGSVLFATLRETHSYTYSPFSYVTRGRKVNRISMGADVRTAVTDSAITVILRELGGLVNDGPDEEALNRRVTYLVGQYGRAFERGSTVASLLLQGWLNDVSPDVVAGMLDKIKSVDVASVHDATKLYLGMFNLRIVVVGSPDIRSRLEQFGPIKDFTLDLEPLEDQPWEPVSKTADQIAADFVRAIGGADALQKSPVITLNATAEMTMQGRTMSGTFDRVFSAPNKEYVSVNLGVVVQKQWVDGTSVWTSLSGGQPAKADAAESRQLLFEARLLPGMAFTEDGVEAKVLGKREGVVGVDVKTPSGMIWHLYYDESTSLLKKVEKEMETPQGILTTVEAYDGWTAFGSLKLPTTVRISNSIYSISYTGTYNVNATASESTFRPEGN